MDAHHLLLWRIMRKKDLPEVYAMMSLRTFAMSLISIFVPIYLYTLGYDIPTILLFFIVASSTHALICPISAKISSAIGSKHGMLLGFILYFPYYVMLTMLQSNGQLFYLIAVSYGVAQALFWIPFHAFFPRLTDGKKRGEEVALLDIFPSLCAMIAPFIGGLIILFFGFGTLFIVGLGFLMVAALPLFATKDIHMPFKFSLRVDGFNRKVAASLASYHYQINETLWPIFVFTIIGSTAIIGGIISVSVLIGFAVVWIVGNMVDRGYRKRLLEAGSVTQAVLWGLRTLANSFLNILSLEAVWRVVAKFTDVPYNSAYCEKARKTKQQLEFSVLREICIHSSIVIVFALLYVFYSYLSIPMIFVIAATGSLFGMLIER